MIYLVSLHFCGFLSVTEHIESVDAEKSSIALTTRENVQRWMAESNISNHIRAIHQLIQTSWNYQW